MLRPGLHTSPCARTLRLVSVKCTRSRGRAPTLIRGSQTGADWRARLSPDPAAGAWVALGKFDALHRGHAALAAWAAARPGVPWLISFSGMAAVLGWRERLPLVAPGDRARILSAWGKEFGVTPRELRIPFAEVRGMDPEAFLRLLSKDLGVAGVVVGEGFRFGYKAAGDTEFLARRGIQLGMEVCIQELVTGAEGEEAVSSSRVRDMLAQGNLRAVRSCLGRPHRLVLAEGANIECPSAAFLNQPPGPGLYAVELGAGAEAGQARISARGLEILAANQSAWVPGSGGHVDFLERLDG
ncbi:hypothetical protein ACKKBF_B02245 [Auxenochlorella protothecoides x Auxenochlorella symbiontica]